MPEIKYTSKHAIEKFIPQDRGCYAHGEVNLTFLNYTDGYRYELNNCLIEKGIIDILWNCRCKPTFSDYPLPFNLQQWISSCSGTKLYCANERMKSIGLSNKTDSKSNIVVPEALENLDMIGDVSKPIASECLSSCKFQENRNQMSFSPYPQYNNFFYQMSFCNVASHIWQISCQNANRTYFLQTRHPKLCSVLKRYDEYFGNRSICSEWPENYFKKNMKVDNELVHEMHEYGKENLALVHVIIQSPYVTKIRQDVAMTLTSYVANTGGLLGLCIGFSFISFIEVCYWCFYLLMKIWR